jgi:DNA-binding IclR family transcriptional regulator
MAAPPAPREPEGFNPVFLRSIWNVASVKQKSSDKSRNFIESLSRGFSVLSTLAQSDSPLGLTELSSRTKLSKSTIQRLAYTLQTMQILDRDEGTKKFRLGPRMISVALSVVRNIDLNKVAFPCMKEVAAETGEAVCMGVLSGSEIVYTSFIKSANLLNVEINVGDRFPAHCTSMGKAILANLPELQLKAVLEHVKFIRITNRTITEKSELIRELERVKLRGFSTNDEETTDGVRSVAAAVRDSRSDVIAAVNIIVPCIRATKRVLETSLASKVIDLASKISLANGYRATPPKGH